MKLGQDARKLCQALCTSVHQDSCSATAVMPNRGTAKKAQPQRKYQPRWCLPVAAMKDSRHSGRTRNAAYQRMIWLSAVAMYAIVAGSKDSRNMHMMVAH